MDEVRADSCTLMHADRDLKVDVWLAHSFAAVLSYRLCACAGGAEGKLITLLVLLYAYAGGRWRHLRLELDAWFS